LSAKKKPPAKEGKSARGSQELTLWLTAEVIAALDRTIELLAVPPYPFPGARRSGFARVAIRALRRAALVEAALKAGGDSPLWDELDAAVAADVFAGEYYGAPVARPAPAGQSPKPVSNARPGRKGKKG